VKGNRKQEKGDKDKVGGHRPQLSMGKDINALLGIAYPPKMLIDDAEVNDSPFPLLSTISFPFPQILYSYVDFKAF
jgi:hypothetical protein